MSCSEQTTFPSWNFLITVVEKERQFDPTNNYKIEKTFLTLLLPLCQLSDESDPAPVQLLDCFHRCTPAMFSRLCTPIRGPGTGVLSAPG